MPKTSDTMEEGLVVEWLVQSGAEVSVGDPIVEVETEKATLEVTAEAAGYVHGLFAEAGQSVPVGSVLALIGDDRPTDADLAKARESVVGEAAASATTGAEADRTPEQQPEDPRADHQAPEPAVATGEPRAADTGESAPSTALATGTDDHGRIFASPLARRDAQAAGIDLRDLHPGSGPGGRILRDDVAAAAEGAPAQGGPRATAVPAGRLHEAMARRTTESWTTAPHFYLTVHVDMTNALELCTQMRNQRPEGPRVSLTHLIVRAMGLALRNDPTLNSSYRDGKVQRRDAINVGVAVAGEEGTLTVPVVRDADRLSISDVAEALTPMVRRAREGASTAADLREGSISVSNLGMQGIHEVGAILNTSEAAILGVGAVRPELQFNVAGDVVQRQIASLTLTVDHRVCSGSVAAGFLNEVQVSLERPLRLVR